eukprot:357440-Chlamydomonas_euryale.AAC.4
MLAASRSYSRVSLPTAAFATVCCLLFGWAMPAWMQLIQPRPPSPPPSPPGWDLDTNRNVVLSNTATWQFGAQHVPLGMTEGFTLWIDLDFATPQELDAFVSDLREALAVVFWVANDPTNGQEAAIYVRNAVSGVPRPAYIPWASQQ